jgi:hypothetical protein
MEFEDRHKFGPGKKSAELRQIRWQSFGNAPGLVKNVFLSENIGRSVIVNLRHFLAEQTIVVRLV